MDELVEHNKQSVELINHLAIVLKTLQAHDLQNAAVIQQTEKLAALADALLSDDGMLRIELLGESFVVDEIKVRCSLESLPNFEYLAAEFRTRDLGAIVLRDTVDGHDLRGLFAALSASGLSDAPFESLQQALEQSPHIVVERLKSVQEAPLPSDMRRTIKKTYFNAVSFTKGVMNSLKSGEPVSIKSATRVVRSMVDLVLEEEQLMVGMTAIKDYDEYTYHHSVNVSILSVALGQRLGLGKKALTELGLAAFFHDIGKVEVPNDILNKPSALTDEEWASMRKHPVWGLKMALRIKAIDAVIINAAIANFEHHLNYDYTGYPKVQRAIGQDIYSRIISIADQYDALTSSRVYRRAAYAPDKALSILVKDSGVRVDPKLLKVFINMIGVFPIGTLAMLTTNEFGLVCESNALFPDRPKVRVIVDENGMRNDYVVDLAEKTPEGSFSRSITVTLDANNYRLNLAEYLIDDALPRTPPGSGRAGQAGG